MIRTGVGGWTFEPWRGLFFPPGLPHARELAFASRALRTIEVNGTFYRTQTPNTFAKWAAETPDEFVFTLKAPRYTTQKKVLAQAGESIGWFTASGIDRLGPKLGPILWQFAPTKAFDAEDFAAWLALLPREVQGLPLAHALEVRHPSFATPAFVDLARAHGAAIVFADHDDHPCIADQTANFTYARLQRGEDALETGYDAAALARWATIARGWAAGDAPPGLSYAAPPQPGPRRDVFAFLIHGGKMRAPAGAVALQALVDEGV